MLQGEDIGERAFGEGTRGRARKSLRQRFRLYRNLIDDSNVKYRLQMWTGADTRGRNQSPHRMNGSTDKGAFAPRHPKPREAVRKEKELGKAESTPLCLICTEQKKHSIVGPWCQNLLVDFWKHLLSQPLGVGDTDIQ